MPHDPFLASHVRAILLFAWDPIGVRDCPEAHSEYDSSVTRIVQLLHQHADSAQIAAHLLRMERQNIGVRGDEARARAVADQLVARRQYDQAQAPIPFRPGDRVQLRHRSYESAGVAASAPGVIAEVAHAHACVVDFSDPQGGAPIRVVVSGWDLARVSPPGEG